METLSYHHTYNGKKIGGATQKTDFTLNGSLSFDSAVSLFKHFALAVWEAEVEISYKFINKKNDELGDKNYQTDAIGFGFTNTSDDEDSEEAE